MNMTEKEESAQLARILAQFVATMDNLDAVQEGLTMLGYNTAELRTAKERTVTAMATARASSCTYLFRNIRYAPLRYVGQKCYFADRISDFTDINKTRLGTLTAIDGTRTSPFCMDHAVFFPFMIPADDVTDEKAFKQALDRENDDDSL